jgi:hypothetical protein
MRRGMASPLFIVGNDRSGTTMLRLVLDRSPEIAIPPESMFLTDFAGRLTAGGPADAAAAQALAEEVWAHPKVQLWRLRGAAPRVPEGLLGADAYRFAVEAPFAAYAALRGKSRWGDKTPHYVHHVADLLAVWPEARVVVLVRDGRDVALSLRRMPFGPNNAWAAAQWWARGIRAGMAAEAAHPAHVMTVRYEDLVSDPEAHVRAVCAFAGLAFEPDMLALELSDRSLIVEDQKTWFPTLFDGISTRSSGRWRSEMPPRAQRIFAALAAPELEALGYEVAPGSAATPISARRARWLHFHNELMRNVNFIRLRVFQERGRELRFALARRIRDPIKRAG